MHVSYTVHVCVHLNLCVNVSISVNVTVHSLNTVHAYSWSWYNAKISLWRLLKVYSILSSYFLASLHFLFNIKFLLVKFKNVVSNKAARKWNKRFWMPSRVILCFCCIWFLLQSIYSTTLFLVNFCSKNSTTYKIWTTACWLLYNGSTQIFFKLCHGRGKKRDCFGMCWHGFILVVPCLRLRRPVRGEVLHDRHYSGSASGLSDVLQRRKAALLNIFYHPLQLLSFSEQFPYQTIMEEVRTLHLPPVGGHHYIRFQSSLLLPHEVNALVGLLDDDNSYWF